MLLLWFGGVVGGSAFGSGGGTERGGYGGMQRALNWNDAGAPWTNRAQLRLEHAFNCIVLAKDSGLRLGEAI